MFFSETFRTEEEIFSVEAESWPNPTGASVSPKENL
jgi:hypothetical protein